MEYFYYICFNSTSHALTDLCNTGRAHQEKSSARVGSCKCSLSFYLNSSLVEQPPFSVDVCSKFDSYLRF